ncbi:HPP family protein [Neptunomonas marina]|uniref:CBS domain-containing protein n=1 Tax=Neptunomonas marina TaxID=1815562 RepID=A0A437Q6Z9_9GAMM|nr:CBS domain-containing protein [Neptunomonas marina]RVU30301.1 CBS domain-containing protein [Neptunomonas marina]
MSILQIIPAFNPDIPKTQPAVAPIAASGATEHITQGSTSNGIASTKPQGKANPNLLKRQSEGSKLYGEEAHYTPILTAEKIMSQPLITIDRDDSFAHAATVMKQQQISHLIVASSNGDLLGLVHHEDTIQHGVDSPVAVANFLPESLLAAKPETPVAEIARHFIHHNCNAIPVVNAALKPIGIVCRTDLLEIISYGEHVERWA